MAETKGRQCAHPTPCRAPSAAPAMQNLPAKRRRPRDARAYIRPLAKQQVLRLPRKSYRQSGGDQGTPGRTSDPLQSSKCCACHAKGILAERRRPRDARRTSDPLQSSKCCACHAKSSGDQGTPGRTSDPLQSSKCCACHAKATGDQGTPGRTSDPLQSSKCCACHAKATGRGGGDQGTLGVHPTPCRAASAAPATQKAAETKGRQGVHPTPCRVASAAPATQKTAETKGRQGVHLTPCRAPSAALAMQKPPAERRRPGRQGVHPTPCRALLRLPRKSYRQSGGDQGTPGRASDPLQSSKCCACHAKATGRAAETKGRQGVHPTPCRAPSAAPATQNLPAKRRRPRDARAYIRPLAEQQVLRPPRKSYRQSGGDQGTPSRTSDPLQSSKCCACHAKSNGDQGTPGRTSDPLQSSKCCACHAKSYRQSGGDQGTPGRTSDPLQSSKCCACHAKSTGDQGTPGRTSDPLQSTKCRACHAKNVSEGEWVSECE